MESNAIELEAKHETGKKSYDKIFKKKSVTEKPKKRNCLRKNRQKNYFSQGDKMYDQKTNS